MDRRKLLIGVGAALAFTFGADAALLDLTLLPSPDITSGFIDVDYNAGTGAFAASGFALSIFDGTDSHNISNGSFDLSATIDNSGMATGGSITIGGEFLGFSSPLLTGSLLAFGFQPGGGDLFEFLFTVTGGDLASPGSFGEPDAVFGVILNAGGSNFTGDWTMSFNNNNGVPGTGLGVADTAPIPAPSVLSVLLIAGWGARRRRRSG